MVVFCCRNKPAVGLGGFSVSEDSVNHSTSHSTALSQVNPFFFFCYYANRTDLIIPILQKKELRLRSLKFAEVT